MAREALTVILLYAGHLFTATGGTGASRSGSSANPEVICRGERSLQGDGFHRDLTTYLAITTKNDVKVPMQCETLLIENLSSSFYIDPFQIENAQEFGGPKVFSYDDIDLEKPAFLSPPLRLFVFRQLQLLGDMLSSNVTLPLHVRYHKPFEGLSHVPVEVAIPEIYVACHPDAHWLKSFERTEAPCSKDTSVKCVWTQISCAFPEESLSFVVPVGNLLHFTMIIVLTVLIIGISTVGIVAKMFFGRRSTVSPSSTSADKKCS